MLFLCTGNSCRSIIGEALVTHLSGGVLQGESAGSMPTGEVNPNALKVLAKHDVAIEAPRSKSWDEFSGVEFGFVITVCDQANNEVCPAFAGNFEKLHWSIPDPAYVPEEQMDEAFEATLQQIKQKIVDELLPRIKAT